MVAVPKVTFSLPSSGVVTPIEFRVQVIEAHDMSLIDPDNCKKQVPAIYEVDGEMRIKPERPTVPHGGDFLGPVAFTTTHYHDGTRLFTCSAISVLARAADQYAADKGGDWEMSDAIIHSEMGIHDMPYGKGVKVLKETVILSLRPKP